MHAWYNSQKFCCNAAILEVYLNRSDEYSSGYNNDNCFVYFQEVSVFRLQIGSADVEIHGPKVRIVNNQNTAGSHSL